MSKFRTLILEAFILAESEAKIDFFLNNKKSEDDFRRAIQNDPEIEDKNITPKELLLQWDKDNILGKNILWIAKQYSNNVFHFGDIYKIKEDLEKFEKYKKNNNIFNSADLNKYDYNTLKQKLNNIDDNNINQLGSSARKSAIEKGKDEIEKYYENDKWFIIIPKTEAASRYWGKNTRWCTAADSAHNMFSYYNDKGPLYILINKNNPNEKYQFHFETSQFMDADDHSISSYLPIFLKDNPEIKSIFKNEVDKIDKTNYKNWIWLDKDTLPYDQCLETIKREGWLALNYVPKELKTSEMCLEAVKQNSFALNYVPEELKTSEICLEAVKQNPFALKSVPEELKTLEMCWVAVKRYTPALQYVPEELKTPKMCLEAVKQDSSVLQLVPEKFITPKMCLEVVEKDPWNLRYVPEKFITPKMCSEAVKQDAAVLKYIPEDLITSEMCWVALEQYSRVLEYVPEKLKTQELCWAAVKKDGSDLEYVPEELKTLEMCWTAVKNEPVALAFIPKKFKTSEMCLDAVKRRGSVLQYVPEELKTLEMCRAAVEQRPHFLQFVPEEIKNLMYKL